jgi:hypothetical protein
MPTTGRAPENLTQRRKGAKRKNLTQRHNDVSRHRISAFAFNGREYPAGLRPAIKPKGR